MDTKHCIPNFILYFTSYYLYVHLHISKTANKFVYYAKFLCL